MLRVERLRGNRCDAGETPLHLVFGHAEATASEIRSVIWGPLGDVGSPMSLFPKSRLYSRRFVVFALFVAGVVVGSGAGMVPAQATAAPAISSSSTHITAGLAHTCALSNFKNSEKS